MLMTILYAFFALIGLGFLIFIHELGHYLMARRVGMKVDVFSIGFGKAILKWERDGVKWQLGWIPFGGYVKIAGVDPESTDDLTKVEGGYFSKTPWQRIQVAFMGPFANFLFAFVAFTIIWMVGGREKDFSEFTPKVGWVDPKSELYEKGVRPGDEIHSYNGVLYQNVKDHLYAPMTSGSEMDIRGAFVDYKKGDKTPFHSVVSPYQHPASLEEGILTAGVLAPANYLVFSPPKGKSLDQVLPKNSPMSRSGIRPGDRLVWVDGEVVFSLSHLSQILNDQRSLLTVLRDGQHILRRVPRVQVDELRLDTNVKEELLDWQHEARLSGVKIDKLYTIPYDLTPDGVIENQIRFIDSDSEKKAFPKKLQSEIDQPLQSGDRIVAVGGVQIKHAYQLFYQLQQKRSFIIVERDPSLQSTVPGSSAEIAFEREVNWNDIETIASSIGSRNWVTSSGNLHLLRPVTPVMRKTYAMSQAKQSEMMTDYFEQRQMLEEIEDPVRREKALRQLDQHEKEFILGIPYIQDRKIVYNPDPFTQFSNVFNEIGRTLVALFTGSLNPKWMAGPIGIVQVMQQSWGVSLQEVLYWLGFISLNLAVLNLLPIPVLDGGYICVFLFEILSGKRVKPQTLEKLLIPFFLLVIGFILFVTYNDVLRVFSVYWS